ALRRARGRRRAGRDAPGAGRGAHAARGDRSGAGADRRAPLLRRLEHRRDRRRARHVAGDAEAALEPRPRLAVPRAERRAVMTPEQQRRVRDLFEAALDRDDRSARDWLATQAADDAAVRDEVLSLFDHHSRAGTFLVDAIADRMPQLLVDDEPLAEGATIGGYTIVRELGRGGMGRVYLASDATLGRMVALKALAPHLVSDPRQRERLRREARAAAALTHPGICTVYALEEIDG